MPPCLSFVRLVPVVIAYVSVHSSLVVENSGLLRLVGLKEYGLGTQSLGLDWPLSEVGTPSPHNSGMPYGLETEKKQQQQVSIYHHSQLIPGDGIEMI